VARREAEGRPWHHARLVCGGCGLTKEGAGESYTLGSNYGPPTDPFMKLDLWLQAPCCGQTLWAYNPEHLDFIEGYVSADLRQGRGNSGWGLASKLPRWMILRKNRDEVLRGVGKLRRR
jgi:hypothetical protein